MGLSSGSMGNRVGQITTVGISDTIRSDLGLKGGGLPEMLLPDQSEVQFVYLLNPNISVTAGSSLATRTSQSDSVVVPALSPNPTNFFGTALLVPDGANKIHVAAYITAFTAAGAAATSQVGWQGSNDGTNFTNLNNPNSTSGKNQVAITATGQGFDSWNTGSAVANTLAYDPASSGLPKYVRAVFTSLSTLNAFTANLVVTVS
jgi:hypothetical protein